MFDQRAYLVKERIGLLKLCDTYDIFDPETGEQIGVAKEEIPGWAKLAWLIVNKRLLPTTSADNYMISLNDGVGLKPAVAKLLLAAGIANDTVFKEGQS